MLACPGAESGLTSTASSWYLPLEILCCEVPGEELLTSLRQLTQPRRRSRSTRMRPMKEIANPKINCRASLIGIEVDPSVPVRHQPGFRQIQLRLLRGLHLRI